MVMQAERDGRWLVQFDGGMPELVHWLETTPARWASKHSRAVTGAHGRYNWTLGANYSDALRLARDGWEAGVQNLHSLAAAIPNNVVVTREYSVAGDHPDVPRYLAGDPFNMVKRGKQRVPKPTMTLCLSIWASGGTPARNLANYGAAMVSLIDKLESRGVRVEAWAAFPTEPYNGIVAPSWLLKRAGDHLDLSALAFSLAHPACLRRLGFALCERAPANMDDRGGYGHKVSLSRKDFVDVDDGALFIDGIGVDPYGCNTLAGAVEHAKAQISAAYAAAGHGDVMVELEELD